MKTLQGCLTYTNGPGQDAGNRLRLQTLPRRNQKLRVAPEVKRLFNAAWQIIETVNGLLSEQFSIETNHAHIRFSRR